MTPSPATTPAAARSYRAGIVIPVYNHAHAIARVVDGLQATDLPIWLIDDGSDPACAAVLDTLAANHPGRIHLERLPRNQGKGLALAHGFRVMQEAGCTHALQIDADGQHDPGDAPRFIAASRQAPDAVVSGVPIYDATVPRGRLYGRYITHFWVAIHTASRAIGDSMCGFRLYPLAATNRVIAEEGVAARMAFDTDIIVRLHWRGIAVVNLPTRVHYPWDGVSHFDMLRDNLRISRMHTRLFFTMLWRRLGPGRRIRRPPARSTGRS